MYAWRHPVLRALAYIAIPATRAARHALQISERRWSGAPCRGIVRSACTTRLRLPTQTVLAAASLTGADTLLELSAQPCRAR